MAAIHRRYSIDFTCQSEQATFREGQNFLLAAGLGVGGLIARERGGERSTAEQIAETIRIRAE